MDKLALLEWLDQEGISYELVEHPVVETMEALNQVEQRYPGYQAKNLFVRDDKKQRYLLITVMEDQTVDMKKLRRELETRRLSFASADDLAQILKLTPGSVTPFGLLNDQEHSVEFVLDQDYLAGEQVLGIHPNHNDATVWINTNDLLTLLDQHGTTIHVLDFDAVNSTE